MASLGKVLKQGAINVEIVFHFVELNEATGLLEDVDISTAFDLGGTATGVFKKPGGSVRAVPLVDAGATATGRASYFSAEGFLDEFGRWEAEGRVNLPGSGAGTGYFPSLIVEFHVEESLVPLPSIQTPEPVILDVGLPSPTIL